MGTPARFHTYQTWRQSLKERQDSGSSQAPPEDRLAGLVNAVNLKHVLRQIETDRNCLHG
jgi:hypothetical protein